MNVAVHFERILVLLVSGDKIACAVSCLFEKLFGPSGQGQLAH